METQTSKEKPLIFDLDFRDLKDLINKWEEPSYRPLQVWQGLYQQLWYFPNEFTTLPKRLRRRLQNNFRGSAITPEQILNSHDKTTSKTIFYLSDEEAIETVLIRYKHRRTLCISTQVGCALGCIFCATGQMGFRRHLTSGEIVEQAIYFARQLKVHNERITNVVFMGMGEPFHNYHATMAAIDRLSDSQGFNLGERRFTISTVGLVPMIRQFSKEKRQVNLAISLHAANDELRSSLLPINKKYPINELINSCLDYIGLTGRRITFEWALIKDINDKVKHAKELVELLQGLLCHVNIIPLNPTNNYRGEAAIKQRVQAFSDVLTQSGIQCSIRTRKGIDIQAGCGQLATHFDRS